MRNSSMYKRNIYLSRIRGYIDKPVIKIITGMRRTGKSCFLKLLADELLQRGIEKERILIIKLDSLSFEHLRDYRSLNDYITGHYRDGNRMYVLIDEVQECSGWERCIESLFENGNYDLYLSGSNAHMLSSDLSTLLSGRYVTFPLFVLGFAEYLQFMQKEFSEAATCFPEFLKRGGFPALIHFDDDLDVVYEYISSLYNTILLKDVVQRNQLRNVALLENVTRYVFDNVGNIFSSKKVADYLKSQRLSVGVNTVQNYLSYLCDTFVLHKVARYDLKGKRLLEMHEKYYLGDVGFRHARLGYRDADISGVLENVVFLELKRRGYEVFIGKLNEYEIDFVAEKAKERIYIQVAYLLTSKETLEREFRPLLQIKDNYPKFLLSMDTIAGTDYEGIKRVNLVDFLLEISH